LIRNTIFAHELNKISKMYKLLLLFSIATISCKSTPSNFIKTFEGTVDGNPVAMQLQSNNGTITGTYYYKDKGRAITLKGETGMTGTTTIKEFYNGAHTGTFSGEIADGAFSGNWSNAEGSNSLNFLLIESNQTYEPRNESKPVAPKQTITDLSEYVGTWTVYLECLNSDCSFSVPGERVAETWVISMDGDHNIKIKVDGSKHKVKGYSCFPFDRGNVEIDIESTAIGLLGKYSTAKGRISAGLTGKIILAKPGCQSQWSVSGQRKATVQF
jgi:hypothetical protein